MGIVIEHGFLKMEEDFATTSVLKVRIVSNVCKLLIFHVYLFWNLSKTMGISTYLYFFNNGMLVINTL